MDDTIDSIYMINDVRMHSLHDMVVRASTNGVFEPETFKHWTSRTTGGIAIDVGHIPEYTASQRLLMGLVRMLLNQIRKFMIDCWQTSC